MIDIIGTLRRLALASVCTSVRGGYIDQLHANTGASATGRAITSTIHVSPDGDGTNGYTWSTAYQTIQDALDNAPTDVNELTLILVAPQTGGSNYDIDTTGDPTWSANVIIKGSHRQWVKIKNTHASATSILKLTGLSALEDLNFNLGTGSANGVILTGGGFRIDNCNFVGEDLTGAATAIHIDGSPVKYGKIRDTDIRGHVTHMIGILLDNADCTEVTRNRIGFCATAIQVINAGSDNNKFSNLDICSCTLGFDIDAGNNQQFGNIYFLGNTRNVDDEVADHMYTDMKGAFPIYITSDNLAGTAVACGGAGNTYGADTQLIAANAIDNPFRIVGVAFAPDASPAEWYMVRFSADSGSTWYDTLMFLGDKREGIAAPSGTEFIFNADTRISCSAKSVSGGNNVDVWLEIQVI